MRGRSIGFAANRAGRTGWLDVNVKAPGSVEKVFGLIITQLAGCTGRQPVGNLPQRACRCWQLFVLKPRQMYRCTSTWPGTLLVPLSQGEIKTRNPRWVRRGLWDMEALLFLKFRKILHLRREEKPGLQTRLKMYPQEVFAKLAPFAFSFPHKDVARTWCQISEMDVAL